MATSENPGFTQDDAANMRDAARNWGDGLKDGQNGVNNESRWGSTEYQEGQMAGEKYRGSSEGQGGETTNQA